ncbi:MAG: DUF429 domain-containing protein [Thermomicrobiales bacterium]
MKVVGVDGCPGGWVAVTWDTDAGTLDVGVHWSFAALLDATADAAAIAVDIPIGLPGGKRGCDSLAKQLLAPKKSSSVFPAPDPRLLSFTTYAEANAWSKANLGKGISKQVFAIFPKIAEVNGLLAPAMQDRVFEVHPEVSFCVLAGSPVVPRKGKPEGYCLRRTALMDALGLEVWCRDAAFGLAKPARPDDILDATVAAWTARRKLERRATLLADESQVDAKGLRAEIVA